jgi:predicted SAM-dependent methyltransferase
MNRTRRFAVGVPWWGKIAAKVILARLPVDYKTWKQFHLFQHGTMEEPGYAHQVFKDHFDVVRSRRALDAGFVGMELGPGDSLLSAMVAQAYGASAYHLVDVGDFAQADLKGYGAMADFLTERGLPTLDVKNMTTAEAVLAACRATYGTSGLSSLRAIPDKSVDFIWSHTCIQHIKRAEFSETMRELRRVLRVDGISSHWVDLEDMLGGALNNLRFRESVWESSFMARSGFYTNRIRYAEMLDMFKEAGFEPEVVHVKRWDRLPTSRSKLWQRFRNLPDNELRVRCFHVVLRPT